MMAAEKVTRAQLLKKYKKKTPMQETMARFMKNRLAIVGLILFLILLIPTIFADQIADYEDVALKINVPNRLKAPTAEHILGTDEMGRDIFARVLHGARTSLWIAGVATLFALVSGGAIGSFSGYVGGKLDEVIMRLMDVMMCLPEMLLAIAIVSAWGANTINMILALGISRIPRFARIVRSSVLTVRTMEYVEASRAIGASRLTIIMQHILPNCLGPILVQVTLIFASAILGISSLSFLGLGVKPPSPEWGNMLATARVHMRDYPHLVLAPGMAIFLSIFSLNLLGDGLRDAFDPKLRK